MNVSECWEGPELPGWDVPSVLSGAVFSWWVALVPVVCFLWIASSLRFIKRACRSWLAMEFVFLIVGWVCVASHPGYADAVFILGIVNPTGLRCNTKFVAVPMVHGGNFNFRMAQVPSTPFRLTRKRARLDGQAR